MLSGQEARYGEPRWSELSGPRAFMGSDRARTLGRVEFPSKPFIPFRVSQFSNNPVESAIRSTDNPNYRFNYGCETILIQLRSRCST